MNVAIILSAICLLAGLLYFEKKEASKGLLPTKAVLSILFVICAGVQPHPDQTYFLFIFIGLTFCLAGDILLVLRQDRMFLFGLVAFLVGHVFYVTAFFYLAEPNRLTLIGAFFTVAVSVGIYAWLRPHLGSMYAPVVFYIIVISCMLCGAWSVLGTGRVPPVGQAQVFVGAVCFYVSDLFVARDRFLKQAFINRLVGLPLYYTGQFLIAFSVGRVIF